MMTYAAARGTSSASLTHSRAAHSRYGGARPTWRTHRGLVIGAALLAGTALTGGVAGCGGSTPTPATGLPTTAATVVTLPTADSPTSTTKTASTTTTGTTSAGFDVLANMPPAAKQHTNAGAQAFVRYYIDAIGRLLMNPAKGQLPKLYLAQCSECADVEASIAETVDWDLRWGGVYYRTLNVTEPDNGSAEAVDAGTVDRVHVLALLTTDPVAVRTGSASPTTRPHAGNVLVDLQLQWRDGQWFVADSHSNQAVPASR